MMKKKILFILIFIIIVSFFSFEKSIVTKIISVSQDQSHHNLPSNNDVEYTLEIPKINLNKPCYFYSSKLNTVDKGLEQISNCKPNENCTIVIASHSGNSNISYFKNLELLSINDQAIIYFNQKKYLYLLKKITFQEKIGFITIPKNTYDLVLTTCNKDNENLQNIYLFTKL